MEGIIDELYKLNCIKTGNFTLKNGRKSRYYYNLKSVVSVPRLVKIITRQLSYLIDETVGFGSFDRICGVPLGGLPFTFQLSFISGLPVIIPRGKAKKYGMCANIEGEFQEGERCIVIEDVTTSCGSIRETYKILKSKGMNVLAFYTIIDRMESGIDNIDGIPIFSLINKTDLVRHNLNRIIKEKSTRLCFSADLTDGNKIIELLDKVGENIAICKLHTDIIENFDEDVKTGLIDMANKHNFLLMEDRKFSDISIIVDKQWDRFRGWVDLVTVHGNVMPDVVSKLYGVLLVSDMSNNEYDHWVQSIDISKKYPNHILGFITQKTHREINRIYRFCTKDYFFMTPGINFDKKTEGDQKFRNPESLDTDICIVGRGIYNSEDFVDSSNKYKLASIGNKI